MTKPFIIEPLTAHYNREAFDCGEESLNDFLKRFARQNNDKGLGRSFVAAKSGEPKIYGYYTIASGAVSFEMIPEKLPRYPISVVLFGQIGS